MITEAGCPERAPTSHLSPPPTADHHFPRRDMEWEILAVVGLLYARRMRPERNGSARETIINEET